MNSKDKGTRPHPPGYQGSAQPVIPSPGGLDERMHSTVVHSLPSARTCLGTTCTLTACSARVSHLGCCPAYHTHLHVLEATIPPAPLGQLTGIASQRRLS